VDVLGQLNTTLSDRYHVERELGGGGMARVFLAEERALERQVVLKVLSGEASEVISAERFQREIHIAARLQHPLIVPVLSAGEAGGLLYYAMPYVEGESLRERLRREGPLPITDAIRILRDTAAALSFAHGHDVVHRDVKPDNILLSGGYAVVTDFGVARALTTAAYESTGITASGVALGTPTYMAPEQVAADPHIDQRADIYALGVVAYEMLTGISPFAGPSLQAVMAAHVTRTPEALTVHRQAIPTALNALVMRCLAKQPADRPQSAAEVTHELEALLATESTASAARARGITPDAARPIRSGMVLGVLGVSLAAVLGTLWLRGDRQATANVTPPPATTTIQSVAVLPFVNSSPDPENEYFSDGLTEELIDALAGAGALRVPSRSSSFAFKGSRLGARAIGESLHVEAVIEGSVRKSGDRLRATAQLTRVSDGTMLWSNRYDRAAGDVFVVQEDLARSILGALRARLSGGAVVRQGTTDREAYELYLRGRYFWNQRTQLGLERAANFFEQALRRDSTFARAWAGLADSYCIAANLGFRSAREVCPRSTEAARRAIQLDPTLAEAHASLGFVHMFYDWDWGSAEQELLKAVELDSTYASAHLWLGHLAWVRGDTAEMLRRGGVAVTLEPLSPILNTRLGGFLWRAGKLDEALVALRRTFEIDSTFPDARVFHALVQIERGDPRDRPEAMSAIERYASLPMRAYGYARVGRADEARRLLREIEQGAHLEYLSPLRIGYAYAALGAADDALRWIERSYESREPDMVFIEREPFLTPMRRDPRFQALVTRVRRGG
jgi:serine/threonine protein kinase/tetratricopeptide (TPR) repeat protein